MKYILKVSLFVTSIFSLNAGYIDYLNKAASYTNSFKQHAVQAFKYLTAKSEPRIFGKNYTDEDFKRLNQHVFDSLQKKQLPEDLILLVKDLIAINKLDMTITNRDQDSFLMLASLNGHAEIVKLLTENFVDINKKNRYGYTSLMRASFSGYIDIAKLLINKGADINAQNRAGNTALTIANSQGHTNIAKLLTGDHDSTKQILTDFALKFANTSKNAFFAFKTYSMPHLKNAGNQIAKQANKAYVGFKSLGF